MKNMDAGEMCSSIPLKTLVELTLPDPASSNFTLVIITREGGVFSWRIG